MSNDLRQQILRTDASGMPLEWIDYQQAAKLFFSEQVAYTLGSELFCLHGGINSASGIQSSITIHSIIATYGKNRLAYQGYVPPLNNETLFRRDGCLCLYCGGEFSRGQLSRDHVRPLSQNGPDEWTNVVSACKRCNNRKAGRTPEQAGMELLAVPFVPTYAEYIFLKGRKVLADQMEFLKSHFPRNSPLRNRLSN